MVKGKSKCPFCGGCKVKPFTGTVGGQDCNECDKNGMISNNRLKELELFDMIEKPKDRFTRDNLNAKERKIYDAVMRHFPATNPETAYDVAVQGGTRLQFIPK